jgi:DNA-binding MarR family transcriptional regulator
MMMKSLSMPGTLPRAGQNGKGRNRVDSFILNVFDLGMSTESTPALTNRLGAFAVALGDRQAEAVARSLGLNPTRAAALVSIGADPGLGATALAAVLGITQSVATRLAEDLLRAGLVEKRPGRTAREVALCLTDAGRSLRHRILATRAEVAATAVDAVPPDMRDALALALDRLLEKFSTDRRRADHICRLCDEDACGQESCPVERAALRAME